MTTACLAQTDVVPVSHGQAITSAPVAGCGSGGCGGGCAQDDCGNQGWGQRLCGKLGGLFHRNSCDSCGGGSGGLFGGHGHHQAQGCCQSAPTTGCGDGCGNQGGGQNFFGRLKGLFHRHQGGSGSGCCDGCGGAGYGGAGYGTGPGIAGPIPYGSGQKVEKLDPPKDAAKPLPNGKEPPKEEKKDEKKDEKGVSLDIPGQIAPQIAPNAPTLQPAPALNPATPADLGNKERSPF